MADDNVKEWLNSRVREVLLCLPADDRKVVELELEQLRHKAATEYARGWDAGRHSEWSWGLGLRVWTALLVLVTGGVITSYLTLPECIAAPKCATSDNWKWREDANGVGTHINNGTTCVRVEHSPNAVLCVIETRIPNPEMTP